MRAFKVFVFGLLYGWFFKIAFDRIYHQNDMEDLRNENASLRDYIRSLEMKLEARSLETRSARMETSAPQAVPLESASPTPPATTIYAALASLTKKDLENILGSQIKRLQDENDLLAQAKKLARKR